MLSVSVPSPTIVSISSRILISAGCTGPLNVSRLLPPSIRTRRADRQRWRSSLHVSRRQSSWSRRPWVGVAPVARTAARAASALSNRSLTSRSRVAAMRGLFNPPAAHFSMSHPPNLQRFSGHTDAVGAACQRRKSHAFAENQDLMAAAKPARQEQCLERQSRLQVGDVEVGAEPEQEV